MADDKDDKTAKPGNDASTNEGKALVPASTAKWALTSTAALKAAFNKIDRSAIGGQASLPMLQYRSREKTYTIGTDRIKPEENSRWAVNIETLEWGWVCFNESKQPVGEVRVHVTQPLPDKATLPNKGFPWREERTVELKCLDGINTGLTVMFTSTTQGGMQTFGNLVNAVIDRINSEPDDDSVAPVIYLEETSYQHSERGRIWKPLLTIGDWMPRNGPAPELTPVTPTPTPTPPSPPPAPPPPAAAAGAEPGRRRRVA
jgi:hypothetical protein